MQDRAAFELVDTEVIGYIGCKEVCIAMRALGFDPTMDEISENMDNYDCRTIDFSGVQAWMTRKRLDPNSEISRPNLMLRPPVLSDDRTTLLLLTQTLTALRTGMVPRDAILRYLGLNEEVTVGFDGVEEVFF